MKHVADFYVPLAWRNDYCGIEKLTLQGLDFYFVDNESYFKRDSLYGYFDDGERFAFFAKAVCEAIARVPELECDVLHCNDWQTALCPVFLREFYREVPACNNVKCVFTVHNVKFQGQYGDKMLQDVLGVDDIPAARDQLRCDADSINFMKGALCYSDWLTTVSPSYACELQMPFFGEGLDGIFRRRSNILSGILNGIDQGIWNPATDSMIPRNFSPKDMSGKAECKRALQEELGPGPGPHPPARGLHRAPHQPEGPGTRALRHGRPHGPRRAGGRAGHRRRRPGGGVQLLQQQVRQPDVRAHRV